MSLELISKIFKEITKTQEWALLLLNVKPSKKHPTMYQSRLINLPSEVIMDDLIYEISDIYVGSKNKIGSYKDVRSYGDVSDSEVIYKIEYDDQLISADYYELMKGIENADLEQNPFLYESAYLLDGNIRIDNQIKSVKMFSMQKPITTVQGKYDWVRDSFKKVTKKYLDPKRSIDVVIVDNTVYLLSINGEKLFNIERSYYLSCLEKIKEIRDSGIVSDMHLFESVASKGHNPRLFLAFNPCKLESFKDVNVRVDISKKFSIPLDSNNKFEVKDADEAERIIKLLCDKGMIDPVDGEPKEVDGARSWG